MTAIATPAARTAGGLGRASRPGVILSALVIVFLAAAAIAPGLLSHGSPDAVNLGDALQGPGLHHVFGTDQSGRDVYTRLIYGARQSLLIGAGATGLAMGLAVVLGLLAGLSGRFVDGIVNRFLEVLFAFPGLLLALLFVTAFGPGASTQIIAVGLGSAPGYARMIRGQVLSVKGSAYVEAARAAGHPPGRIIGQHIVPNAMRPLVALATMGVGQSIVWASALSFLGLGVPPPAPEWGAMLDAGRNFVTQAWWLEIFPGLAIVTCSLSVTALGRHLRQRFEGDTG